jgi:hypothetical protein
LYESSWESFEEETLSVDVAAWLLSAGKLSFDSSFNDGADGADMM